MLRSLLITSFLLAWSVLSQAAPKSLEPIKVQINWNHQFQFAGFYAAVQQGYYQQAGMDVEINGWRPGIDVVNEVIDGRVDFAVGYSSVIADYAKGRPIKLLMTVFQYSPMVLLSHTPINSLSEMSGKTVMHDRNMQIAGLIDKVRSSVTTPIVSVPPSGDLQDFIDGKVDFYGAYSTNEPTRLEKLGIPYYIIDPKVYGLQSYGDFIFTSSMMTESKPELVEAFKQATIQGWQYALQHPQEVIDFLMENYAVVKSRQDLLKEAELTKDFVRYGNFPIGSFYKEKLLSSALDAKLAGLMSNDEYHKLSLENFIFQQKQLLLSEAEMQFVIENPVVKIANDVDWQPFEYIDENKAYKGLAADYLELISQRTGLQFEFLVDQPWNQAVAMAKSGELDMYSCAVATPKRQNYMQFTNSYLSFPMVLAANQYIGYISDYAQLRGKTVAVVDSYWSDEFLTSNYPDIEVLRYPSIQEALSAVSRGEALVYSGNLASIVDAVKKYGFANIQIVGQSSESFDLAIGVQKGKQVLFNLMQKALESISPEERKDIYNRWLQVNVMHQVDNKKFYSAIIPLLALVLLLTLFIVLVLYQKRQKDKYLNKVHELSLATTMQPGDFKLSSISQSFKVLSGISSLQSDQQFYLYDVERITLDELKKIRHRLEQGHTVEKELESTNMCRNQYTVLATFTPVLNRKKQLKSILITRIDITDKKRVQRLAIRDELTGLYNRRYFNDVLAQQIEQAKANDSQICTAMIDLDYFKLINDTYGHLVGDKVLARIAKVLKLNFVRSADYVFRLGGEEFFILSHDQDSERFVKYAAQLVDSVEAMRIENIHAPGKVLTLSMSIKCFKADQLTNAENLYRTMDQLLYQAKQQGRNRALID